MTTERVVEYVEAYERAYAWQRSTRHGGLLEFHIDGEAEAVWTGEKGVHTEFATVFPHGRYIEDGDEYYFDEAPYAAGYLVTDYAIWRAETERGDNPSDLPAPPEPREHGTLLECF